LITVGVAGVLRWPIRRETAEDEEHWNIGPPQLLHELAAEVDNPYDAAWLPDYRAVAVSDPEHNEVVILNVEGTNSPTAPIRLASRYRRVADISVSPDGKWIAGGGHKEPGIQVWNVATGEIACVLPPRFDAPTGDAIFRVVFSPDNRWLVCQSNAIGYCFWESGTWQKGHFLGVEPTTMVGVAFTPDGRCMAASASQDEIMLADPADGRELIRLSTLPVLGSLPTGFHPGGEKFVSIAHPDTVHVWDLKRIREQLAALGLDWEDSPVRSRNSGFSATESDPPSSPTGDGRLKPTVPAEPAKAQHRPLRLTIDSGDTLARLAAVRKRQEATGHVVRATKHQSAGHWKEAIDELKLAVALDPSYAKAHNNLAWYLATCLTLADRDVPLALEHAARAVELGSRESAFRNTLGVCLYRAGDWRRAIEELTKSEELSPGTFFGDNAFFLAMSHWQLGEPDAARTWLRRGVEWTEKNAPTDEELQRFRAEADELLRGDPQHP
jgi:Flp pilus assembly protein TadD